MTIGKLKLETNSFYKRTWGQRGTPFLFFYLLPMLTISRTSNQELFALYIGWLFWNIKITYIRHDNKRRILK